MSAPDSLASIRSASISAFREFHPAKKVDPAKITSSDTRQELDHAAEVLALTKASVAKAEEAVREAEEREERGLENPAPWAWASSEYRYDLEHGSKSLRIARWTFKNAEEWLVAAEARLVAAQGKHDDVLAAQGEPDEVLAAGPEQRDLIDDAVKALEAVPSAEWQQVCRASVTDGVYALTLQSLIDTRLRGPAFPRECLALAVAVHAGVTIPVARELMKRVEHVGPERLLEGVGLDDVIAAQSDFVRLKAKVKITEGVRPGSHGRKAISEQVRGVVWRRDHGRCVDCGSRERLELDHIIPVSAGGSNTARNLDLRCEVCNRAKSNKI